MQLAELTDLLAPFSVTPKSFEKMDGYASENYKIVTEDSKLYVFKIYRDPKNRKIIEAEHRLQHYLQAKVPFKIGASPFDIISYPDETFSRLLPFLEGQFLGEIDHSNKLLFNFGIAIGQMGKALSEYEDDTISSYKHGWDLNRCLTVWPMAKYIENRSRRKLVNYYFDQYEHHARPLINTLRHSIIHGDLNDWNVLTRDDNISGVIDFGDFCRAPLINELAVGLTYIMLSKPHPIRSANHVIKGYQQIMPLTRQEVELLYYLIPARLCQSVCHSQKKITLGTDSDYIRISEAPAWQLLSNWSSYNPLYIQKRFSQAAHFLDNPLPSTSQIIQSRDKHLSPSISLSYDRPIHMSGSAFQYMYDAEGNSYLDAYNNIPHVGHCHPRVTRAIASQLRSLNTNTRYLYDSIAEYTEKLLYHFPSKLDRVFFVNSGSEASDLALRLARNFTQRNDMLVMEHGYHGHTQSATEISHYKFSGKGGPGSRPFIHALPYPKIYQGVFANRKEYVKDARRIISELSEKKTTPAALIAESISGCGGQIPMPEGYLKGLEPFLRDHHMLLILDEVQVGFGRVGQHFWGFQLQDIIPDIVILGKPMANGHPIGAVVTTTEIASAFNTGMEFFSSFGGNPVSMKAANAVLEVIEDEGLQSNALEVGNYFTDSIRKLNSSWIGDVRGHGLFIGVEFTNPETGEPATEFAASVKNELRNNFILTSTDGPFDNVLKMKPSLCFSRENVNQFLQVFEDILEGRESAGFVPGNPITR